MADLVASGSGALLCGAAGIGKSYLVDRFFAQHRDRFPGGYVRLTLDPQSAVPDLCTRLLGLLDLPGGSDPLLAIRARLRDGRCAPLSGTT